MSRRVADGDGNDAVGPQQAAPQTEAPEVAHRIGRLVEQQTAHVVNRHHVGLGHEHGNTVQGDVAEVRGKLADQPGQRDVIEAVGVGTGAGDRPEIARKMTQQLLVFGKRYEEIFVLLVDGRDGRDQISDVRADAEVAQSPGIDRNLHLAPAHGARAATCESVTGRTAITRRPPLASIRTAGICRSGFARGGGPR